MTKNVMKDSHSVINLFVKDNIGKIPVFGNSLEKNPLSRVHKKANESENNIEEDYSQDFEEVSLVKSEQKSNTRKYSEMSEIQESIKVKILKKSPTTN